jgi:hypothetical protein
MHRRYKPPTRVALGTSGDKSACIRYIPGRRSALEIALCTLWQKWRANTPYERRVARLTQGVDGVRLVADLVVDDGWGEALTGAGALGRTPGWRPMTGTWTRDSLL